MEEAGFELEGQNPPNASVYLGEIISLEEGIIRLKTTNLGTLQIPTVNIEKIEDLSGEQMRKGKYWFENPSYNRYFLGQSAKPLRKGEGDEGDPTGNAGEVRGFLG